VSAGVSTAIQGGSFNDYLSVSMENQGNNVLSALAYNQIGNLGDYLATSGGGEGNARQFSQYIEGGIGRVGLHSVAGGLITEATGGDFATGAAAAGLNQWLSPQLDHLAGEDGPWRTAASQLAGLAGAMMVGGDVNDGAWIAKQADTYNRQLHSQELKLIADNYKQYAAERGISEEQALKELIYQAHILVDASVALDKQHADWALLREYDTTAAWAFLQGLSSANGFITHSDGVQTRLFQATDAQWLDSTINRHHLRDIEDGFTGELMGLGRRPILTAFDMNTGIGNYSATLYMGRNEAADALTDQNMMILGGALAVPALYSAGVGASIWLADAASTAGMWGHVVTRAPASWNQFQSALAGRGLNSTAMSPMWTTWQSIGGQTYGHLLRPAVGDLYVSAGNIIAAEGAVVSGYTFSAFTTGFGIGYYSPLEPNLPSGNPLLFPLELGISVGGAVSVLAEGESQ
ncbi:MAG: DUF637 domain-containing protein, partial [Hymenobacteraceae bacterium]|nr:DUF637 domain-containing protein [Hymenobacteraceae bacterium]